MGELTALLEDGEQVTALVEGSGPTLLVVHPGGGDETSWDAVAALLRTEFRVVRLRRRVYQPGGATRPGHSMASEAADVLAVARPFADDGPLVLVGHSSGAVAALEAAVREPGLFAAILVYEPPMPTTSLLGDEGSLSAARAAMEAGDPVEAMRIHLRELVRMPAEWVDALFSDPAVREAFSAYAQAQLADAEAINALGVGTERFRAIDVPTTLVVGNFSPQHLIERSADLAAVLPDARTVRLAGQGHAAHLNGPDALAAVIRETALRLPA